MKKIKFSNGFSIAGLSDVDYHHGEDYQKWLSSSQLKHYRISPLAFKTELDNPSDADTPAMRFGRIFHQAMQAVVENHYDEFLETLKVFSAPINPATDKPYGATTKKCIEAYELFIEQNKNNIILSAEDYESLTSMVASLNADTPACQHLHSLIKDGECETSYFLDADVPLKCRPDVITDKYIIDWKTTSVNELSEREINNIILKYGYHISAALYQYIIHELTGEWREFIIVLAQKQPPYDFAIVSLNFYAYAPLWDDAMTEGPAVKELQQILDTHRSCSFANEWYGSSVTLAKGGTFEINPPLYYSKQFAEDYA